MLFLFYITKCSSHNILNELISMEYIKTNLFSISHSFFLNFINNPISVTLQSYTDRKEYNENKIEIHNSIFRDIVSNQNGGAIHYIGNSFKLTGSYFQSCKGLTGGSIFCSGILNLNFQLNSFSNSTSTLAAGCVLIDEVPKTSTKLEIKSDNLTCSKSNYDGGIEYWGNGGMMKDVLFRNITGSMAGASMSFILNRECTSYLYSCTFADCVSNMKGSSICSQGYATHLIISKSQFIKNLCKTPPGDVFYTAAKKCNAKFVDCIFKSYPNHTERDFFAYNFNDGFVTVIP